MCDTLMSSNFRHSPSGICQTKNDRKISFYTKFVSGKAEIKKYPAMAREQRELQPPLFHPKLD